MGGAIAMSFGNKIFAARPKPAGSGPGHWPDHIVMPQKQQHYYCVRILMSRDCLVVMFTITFAFSMFV